MGARIKARPPEPVPAVPVSASDRTCADGPLQPSSVADTVKMFQRSAGNRAVAALVGSGRLPTGRAVLARAPEDDAPIGGRDPREAQKIGQAGEPEEIGRVRVELAKKGYGEIFDSRQMSRRRAQIRRTEAQGGTPRRQPIDWVLEVFPDGRARPEFVAVNRRRNKILVLDLTASPTTTTDWKPGDARTLPNDAPPGEGGKHHLEKTKEYGRQVARQRPAELAGFDVVAQDRHWKTGKYSKEIRIRRPQAPTALPGIPEGPPRPARPGSASAPAQVRPPKGARPTAKAPRPSARASTKQRAAPRLDASKGSGRRSRTPSHGRGIGIAISLVMGFFASKAEAAVDERRHPGRHNTKGLEDDITRRLTALSARFIELHARAPGVTVYANVTLHTETYDQYVVAGSDVMQGSEYRGTWVEGIELALMPNDATWTTHHGSATEGGTTVHWFTRYSIPLERPPMDEVVAYAKLTGMDLKPLRAEAAARGAEAAKSGDGRVGAHASAHLADLLRLIDADDLELVLRAHTERLSSSDVAAYLDSKIERVEAAVTAGAYERREKAVGQTLAKADKPRELRELLDAPFEDVVDYAYEHGRPLERLRAYAAGRAEQAGQSTDSHAGPAASTYWSQMVRYIDSF